MAITITVEDGTNVANANSYVSVADARTFASNRGVQLPVDNDEVAAMLIQGMDYLGTVEWCGTRTYDNQELDWPRSEVTIDGKVFPSDQIPKYLVQAQCQLAIAQQQGISLLPTVQASDLVTEETVGPITTKYASPTTLDGFDSGPVTIGTVQPLLDRLNSGCNNGGWFTVTRA